MFIKNTQFGKSIIILLCALNISVSVFAATPWWHRPSLDWKPFTALPGLTSTNGFMLWSWDIRERSGNGKPKLFALNMVWGEAQRLCVADSSTNPVFSEIDVSWPLLRQVASTAMSTWNHDYEEFFIGSSSGLWRLDESVPQLVNVWPWISGPDATFIVSLGDSLFGSVTLCGGQSGDHIWSPSGHTRLTSECGTAQIWADPISGRYGRGNYKVRVLSTNLSITIRDSGYNSSQYSLDGAQTFCGSVGVRSDGFDLFVRDIYGYSGTNAVIVRANNYMGIESLFIGALGGQMFPLNCPTNMYNMYSTFFYSPTTRLLIAGNAEGGKLYYAVLPLPSQMLPVLEIQSAVIVSWPAQYSSGRLEGAVSAEGPWQEVLAPRVVIGDTIQVSMPADSDRKFFRLLLQ